MICSFLLTKATYLYWPCLTLLQHLTQLIILLILSYCYEVFLAVCLMASAINKVREEALIEWVNQLPGAKLHSMDDCDLISLRMFKKM